MGVVDVQFVHPEKWCPIPHLGQGWPQTLHLDALPTGEIKGSGAWLKTTSIFISNGFIYCTSQVLYIWLSRYIWILSKPKSPLKPPCAHSSWFSVRIFLRPISLISVGLGLFQMVIFVRQNQFQHIVCHIYVDISQMSINAFKIIRRWIVYQGLWVFSHCL